MARSLLAVGSNLGDREGAFRQAIALLQSSDGIVVVAQSAVHETKPIGGAAGQAEFLNASVLVDTSLSPRALLDRLQQIEAQLGRQRRQRWDARTLDLDILLYDDRVIATPALRVPHPRMAFRRFVLEPAVEIAPSMVHPTIGWSVGRLLEHLNTATPFVALVGMPGSGLTALAARLAQACGGRLLAQSPAAERDDSSGQSLERQIQFLDALAGLLRGSLGPRPGELVISDFSWEQTLARARATLAPAAAKKFEVHWEAVRQGVVLPKLLVVLDEPQGSPGDEAPTDFDRELARVVAQPGQVVVYAGRDNRERQFEEASAAIAAMR